MVLDYIIYTGIHIYIYIYSMHMYIYIYTHTSIYIYLYIGFVGCVAMIRYATLRCALPSHITSYHIAVVSCHVVLHDIILARLMFGSKRGLARARVSSQAPDSRAFAFQPSVSGLGPRLSDVDCVRACCVADCASWQATPYTGARKTLFRRRRPLGR